MTVTAETRPSEAAFHELLARLRCGKPMQEGPLRLVPLFDPNHGPRPEVDLLNEAVVVEETADVNRLVMVNTGPRPCLLLDGDEVAGGMQNRVMNTSVLLPEGKRVEVPVSCVERGRWDGRRRHAGFRRTDWLMPARLRSRKSRSVSHCMDSLGFAMSDQREVWDTVEEYDTALGTRSATESLSDSYAHRAPDLERFVTALEPAPEQVGVVACLGRGRVAFDVLAHPSLYAEVHRRLVRSFGLDALTLEPAELDVLDPVSAARGFLDDLAQRRFRAYPGVGLGKELRRHEKEWTAHALLWKGRVLAASGYRE